MDGGDRIMRDGKLFGIDVATWQGVIDWPKAKADGVDFAIIKATQGYAESSSSYLFNDVQFKTNITNAPKADIVCGVYHYLTAKTVKEAETEADYFVKSITPYKQDIRLYAAVDVESWHLPTNKVLLTDIVNRFCEYVQSKGYKPIVYTNPDWLRNRLNDVSRWPLWLALWPKTMPSNIPSGYGDMKIWQWGASKVAGITGDVDSNYGFYEIGGNNVADDKNKPSDWAAADWQLAQELGITDGTRPLDNVTRQEMVVMILRALGKANSKLK